MEVKNARSVLRILAIACILVGVILTTQLLVTMMAVSSLTDQLSGSGLSLSADFGNVSIYGVIAQLTVVGWGIALFAASSKLSEMIID